MNTYSVTIQTPAFTATKAIHNHPAGSDPSILFQDFAQNPQGWQGEKGWGSMDGELSFSATMDSTGHVFLSVKITSDPDKQSWNVKTTMLIESGQLAQVAKNSKQFFKK